MAKGCDTSNNAYTNKKIAKDGYTTIRKDETCVAYVKITYGTMYSKCECKENYKGVDSKVIYDDRTMLECEKLTKGYMNSIMKYKDCAYKDVPLKPIGNGNNTTSNGKRIS